MNGKFLGGASSWLAFALGSGPEEIRKAAQGAASCFGMRAFGARGIVWGLPPQRHSMSFFAGVCVFPLQQV
ncbi:hypothetical protein DWB63_16235 [Pseudodesulfovibrio sp. S3]|nr:hypothetical protein DWB63_16235 [Pseudodesulfovibrio sp. S3]